jgi:hypothetical protein
MFSTPGYGYGGNVGAQWVNRYLYNIDHFIASDRRIPETSTLQDEKRCEQLVQSSYCNVSNFAQFLGLQLTHAAHIPGDPREDGDVHLVFVGDRGAGNRLWTRIASKAPTSAEFSRARSLLTCQFCNRRVDPRNLCRSKLR